VTLQAGEDYLAGYDLVRQVQVVRQAICDAERDVVAFDLLFHLGPAGRPADALSAERATSEAIAATFGSLGVHAVSDGRPVHANFTRPFLTGRLEIPVAPADVVVRVGPAAAGDAELHAGLTALRQQGYRLALDDYRGEPARAGLLELADLVSVTPDGLDPQTLQRIVAQARAAGSELLALGVDDEATWLACRELGFDLFRGGYLERPAVIAARGLSPNQLVCVRLLSDLADPDIPLARLEQLVGADPGLSLRLLRTANSAGAAPGQGVSSLHQALVMVGPQRLRSWVVLMLLEGGTARTSSDALWTVLSRAHACRRLAHSDPDTAFTVGLLSGAAEVLGAEPHVLADGAGIPAAARAALLDGAGAAGLVLTAVLAHERGETEGVRAAGLEPFDVSRAYLSSLNESLSIVHSLTRS
jgi:c-di-GMP phosphodiesterase